MGWPTRCSDRNGWRWDGAGDNKQSHLIAAGTEARTAGWGADNGAELVRIFALSGAYASRQGGRPGSGPDPTDNGFTLKLGGGEGVSDQR